MLNDNIKILLVSFELQNFLNTPRTMITQHISQEHKVSQLFYT